LSSILRACRTCLKKPDLVVGVENGEIGLQADEFGVAAQDFRADRMKGAHPGHASDKTGQMTDPLAHFARRFVGESDAEDFMGPGARRGDEMGNAGGQNPRLADARSGQDENRPVERLDRLALRLVEAFENSAALRPPARAPKGSARVGRFFRGRRQLPTSAYWRQT